MVKKLTAAAASAAILLSAAVPAFAWHTDFAFVGNSSEAYSNTGGNTQDNNASVKAAMFSSANAGSGSGNRNMNTGNAGSDSTAVVVANTHLGCGGCGPWGGSDVAIVRNSSLATSNTGVNSQDNDASVRWAAGSSANAGSGSGNRNMTTGNAWSDSDAWVVVNTHL